MSPGADFPMMSLLVAELTCCGLLLNTLLLGLCVCPCVSLRVTGGADCATAHCGRADLADDGPTCTVRLLLVRMAVREGPVKGTMEEQGESEGGRRREADVL